MSGVLTECEALQAPHMLRVTLLGTPVARYVGVPRPARDCRMELFAAAIASRLANEVAATMFPVSTYDGADRL